MALSADGSVLLVGSPADDPSVGRGGTEPLGSAWVARVGKNGAVVGALVKLQASAAVAASSASSVNQGAAVALDASGTVAVVGAPGDASGLGAVWTWSQSPSKRKRAGSNAKWVMWPTKLTPPPRELDPCCVARAQFGAAVALSADATTLVVGAPGEADGRGALWVFVRASASKTWVAARPKVVVDASSDSSRMFGAGVSVGLAPPLPGGRGNPKMSVVGVADGVGGAWVVVGVSGDPLPLRRRRSTVKESTTVAVSPTGDVVYVGVARNGVPVPVAEYADELATSGVKAYRSADARNVSASWSSTSTPSPMFGNAPNAVMGFGRSQGSSIGVDRGGKHVVSGQLGGVAWVFSSS